MADQRPRFLGVERSARGTAWVPRLTALQENAALAMAQSQGIDDVLARVLAARDVPVDRATEFLNPTIKSLLPDPRSLTDMDKAAGRIAEAIRRKESIAVFGDYDVDGACSSALLARYLRHFGIDAEIYIPDRVFEGYGPNPDAMRALAGRGATLIVTVDCGTNSAEAIAAANDAGCDVVVLDHHQVGGPLPGAVAVVNANRDDDLSGQGHLCAAGIVFLTLVEVQRLLRETGVQSLPDLLGMVDLVGLATVCDVVPLQGVNRAFVRKGLQMARMMTNPGLAALSRVARIGEPIGSFHFGFVLGPRINAGGRIGNAAMGATLLSSDDGGETERLAAELDRLNGERQQMEKTMLEQAEAEALAEYGHGNPPAVVVTEGEGWHPGIVGLIAARLKEKLRRPAFAIAFDRTGKGTGSGRSISGFDLGHLVRDALAAGLLEKGGGHAMAAGITVERSRLGALRAFFEERASAKVARLVESEVLKIDAAVTAEGASLALVERLEEAGPYGSGYPQPVIALPRHRLVDVLPVGSGHLRLSLQSPSGGRVTAMAFRAGDTELGAFLGAKRGELVHVAGTLGANHWNGRVSVQLRVIDAAPTGT